MGILTQKCPDFTPDKSSMTPTTELSMSAAVIDEYTCQLGKFIEPLSADLQFYSMRLQDIYQDYTAKYRQFLRLNAIHYWSEQLQDKRVAVFNRAKKHFTDQMDGTDRFLIWQEVVQHYYLTGTVSYLPATYRGKLEVLGRCISDNEKVENKVTVRVLMPENCVPPGDSRRQDPEWLVSLLAFHPEPISQEWLNRHIKSLLSFQQINYQSHSEDTHTIYEIPVEEDGYVLTLDMQDGYDLPKDEIQRMASWTLALNKCIPGHEVKQLIFQKNPVLTNSDGSVYRCSYYDAQNSAVVIKIGPVSFDSFIHEFGHALHDSYRSTDDPIIKEQINRLESLYRSTSSIGALTLIKDSYYNAYNVNHDLLYRGHPEDDRSETAASLFNATTRYFPEFFQNIFGDDTPKEHQLAGILFLQWQQEWLQHICPAEVLTVSKFRPWPHSELELPVVSISPKTIDIGEFEENTVDLF